MADDTNPETPTPPPPPSSSPAAAHFNRAIPTAMHCWNCDELWDEVGRIAHEAFSTLNKRRKNDAHQEPDTQQQPEPAISLDLQTPTLKDWIAENVMLV